MAAEYRVYIVSEKISKDVPRREIRAARSTRLHGHLVHYHHLTKWFTPPLGRYRNPK